MSIRNFLLAAVTAAAFVAPTLSAANAYQNDSYRYDTHRYNNQVRLGTHTPGIDRRIQRQIHRIRAGRRNGDLTFREARNLRNCLRDIRRARADARSNGSVSRYERRALHKMLNTNSQLIRELRHNNDYANRFYRKFRKYAGY